MKKKIFAISLLSVAVAHSTSVLALDISEAMLKTMSSNPELGVEVNRYRARQAAAEAAKGGYFPSVDMAAAYGHEWTDSPATRTLRNDHEYNLTRGELSLTLRQLLFDGHRTTSDVARTSAEADAQKLELQATAEDLGLRTANVYLNVMTARTERNLAKQNLEAHQRIYDRIKKRTRQGIGSSSDLSQAEGRLARAHSNLIAADNNRIDAEAEFYRVVGEQAGNLEPAPSRMDMLPEEFHLANEQAQKNHPRLLSARHDRAAANHQIKEMKSSYYPHVFFEVGSSWNDDLDGVDGHNNDVSAMVRVNYNLYSGGSDRNRVIEAENQRGEAADILRNASEAVREGLALSWNALNSLKVQREYLQRHVASSEKTLEAYKKQFELGRRTLIDLLDTENELFEARRSLLAADRDYQLAEYRVLNATGSLLSSFEVSVSHNNQ